MKKILAIDDQKDNLISIKAFLKNFMPDCTLFMAQSGKEGIIIAQREQPDTILLDILMPDMDGFEVCKILKNDERTNFIPILMLSALGQDQGSRSKGLNLGADAFIAKPFNHTELQAQISVMLRIKESEDKLRIKNDELEKLVLQRAKKIAESEKKFRDITERIRDIIIIYDLVGIINYVSSSISRNFGYKPQEVIGNNISDYITKQELTNIIKSFQITISGEYVEDFHSIFLKKDGGIANICLSAQPVFEDKIIVGTQVIIRDITVRYKAEKDLKQSEKDFRDLFNNTSDAIYIQSRDYLFIDVNKGAIDMYGYPKEFFLGKTPAFLSAPGKNDMEMTIKYLEDAFNGIPQQYEFWGIRKSGEIFPKIVHSRLGSYKGQEVVITSAIDITGIKNTQEALSRSEELYRNVFNNAPLGIFHFDRDSVIINSNEAFLRILGTTQEKLIGLNMLKQLNDEGVLNAIRDTFDKGFGYYNNYYTPVTGNRSVPIVIHFKAIHNSDNEIVGGVAIVEDITESKKAEEKLTESERKISTLINNLQGIAYRCKNDRSWTMEFMSEGVVKVTGYTAEKFINNKKLSFSDIIIEKDKERVWDTVQNAINKKETFEVSYQIITASGKIKHLSEKGNPVFNDKTGELIALEGFISDVTTHVLSNITLKASEEQNRSITQTAADAIISINDEGAILSWNDAAETIFGYTAHEMISNDLSVIIPNKYKEKHRNGINSLAQRKNKNLFRQNIELSGLKKDGTHFPLELSLSSWEANNQNFYTAIIRDVTKRNLAQAELLQLSTAVKQSPSVIVITDLDGNIEYTNPKFTTLTGYSPQETKGLNTNLLKSGKQPESFYAEMWQKITSGKIWHGEFHNKKKNGDYFWESASVTPIFNSQNNIINYLKVAEDITECKKSEEVQRILYNIANAVNTTDNLTNLIILIQKELGKVIDTSNFYVALYDTENDTITLPFMQDAKDSITSFPAGKTLTYHVIKTKKELLATKAVVKRLEDSGLVESFGSDSKVWLGVPLKIEGVVTGVLAVQSYTDENAYDELDMKMLEFVGTQIAISIERKRSEEELKKALKKATESDRLKSAFLATISHELRTPLNAIIGFSELIDKDWPIEDIIDFGQTINSSGKHLLSIVNDIFDITLIEIGQTKLNLEKTNINSGLLDVNNYIKAEEKLLNKEGLNLSLLLPNNGADLFIYTDIFKLKQILINLLKNALKFTEKGSITYGYEIEAIDGKQFIKFFVKDTGIGIDKDKQKIIFDVFHQLDDTVTRRYGGVGIGLSISQKLALLLGGNIWVESQLGVGSTFYFTIPYVVSEKAKEAPAIKKVSDNNFRDKTILVVEDDVDSYEYLNILLKQKKANILWAKDGSESVDICTQNTNIDLVLMDINMRGMNGLEATRKIKMFRPDLPIIAQTALAIAGDKEKVMEAGCDDYISKPINKNKLFVIVDEWLSKPFKSVK